MLKSGDLVTWSTLPNGQGDVKKGFVQEISGRWVTLLYAKATSNGEPAMYSRETTLIEFILEPRLTAVLQPRLF